MYVQLRLSIRNVTGFDNDMQINFWHVRQLASAHWPALGCTVGKYGLYNIWQAGHRPGNPLTVSCLVTWTPGNWPAYFSSDNIEAKSRDFCTSEQIGWVHFVFFVDHCVPGRGWRWFVFCQSGDPRCDDGLWWRGRECRVECGPCRAAPGSAGRGHTCRYNASRVQGDKRNK